MRTICALAAAAVLVAGPSAWQAGDAGPVVAIDEGHKNTHTYRQGQQEFVKLLQGDGYRVRPFAAMVTRASLEGVNVLVTINPGGWDGPAASLSESEVAALLDWVRRGGSLLLVLDHMPYPRNAANLTAALGVARWEDGYAMVDVPGSPPAGVISFWRADSIPDGQPAMTSGPLGPVYQGADAILAPHPITEGAGPAERVRTVRTFTGSAFQPGEGAEAVIVLPKRTMSLRPDPDVTDEAVRWRDAPRVSVGEWLQGAVMKMGNGRVALFGEAGLFSAGPAPDNRQFVLNLMRWLSERAPAGALSQEKPPLR